MADEEVMCARISVQMDHYLTCWMHLEGENKKWGIGFGGYDLRGAAGAKYLELLMAMFKVERLEDIKGMRIRLWWASGWGSDVLAIGHRTEDAWFCPKKDVYGL